MLARQYLVSAVILGALGGVCVATAGQFRPEATVVLRDGGKLELGVVQLYGPPERYRGETVGCRFVGSDWDAIPMELARSLWVYLRSAEFKRLDFARGERPGTVNVTVVPARPGAQSFRAVLPIQPSHTWEHGEEFRVRGVTAGALGGKRDFLLPVAEAETVECKSAAGIGTGDCVVRGRDGTSTTVSDFKFCAYSSGFTLKRQVFNEHIPPKVRVQGALESVDFSSIKEIRFLDSSMRVAMKDGKQATGAFDGVTHLWGRTRDNKFFFGPLEEIRVITFQ